MGRAGAGGGGRASLGGNSAPRTGGGHRPGTSGGRRAGSGSLSGGSHRGSVNSGAGVPRGGAGMPPPRDVGPRVPPPRHRVPPPPRHRVPPPPSGYFGPGMPPPGGRYRWGRRPRRGGGCLTTLVALFIVIVIAIISIQKSSFTKGGESAPPPNNQSNTRVREKLDTNNVYINDCVIDELGWFDNVSKTESQLKNFWEKTGVQPYIILRGYDAGLTTDSEKEQWAIDYYDKNFDTENIFLFVYFAEQDTDNEVGYMAYANGNQILSIMDSEAVEIFLDNIDKYWYTDLSTDDVIVNAFEDTADTIMRGSGNGR